jgi:hypothetical protein
MGVSLYQWLTARDRTWFYKVNNNSARLRRRMLPNTIARANKGVVECLETFCERFHS